MLTKRSYDRKVFEKAASILSRHNLKNADEISKLLQFVGRVDEVA